MSARRLSFIAVAATLVALTVACSGDSGGGPSTLPSAPSDSALPSPSAPPASGGTALDPESAAQVEALVREWWASVDRAAQSAEPELLTPLYLPQCEPCGRYRSTITELLEAGQRISGGEHDVTELTVGANAGNTALVNVAVDIRPSDVIDQNDAVVETFGGRSTKYVFNLARDNEGKWLVFDIITLSD
jgi:hypothetical protein